MWDDGSGSSLWMRMASGTAAKPRFQLKGTRQGSRPCLQLLGDGTHHFSQQSLELLAGTEALMLLEGKLIYMSMRNPEHSTSHRTQTSAWWTCDPPPDPLNGVPALAKLLSTTNQRPCPSCCYFYCFWHQEQFFNKEVTKEESQSLQHNTWRLSSSRLASPHP